MKPIESLSLEVATEAELSHVAEHGNPDQSRQARAILLERARLLARVAARELNATLKRQVSRTLPVDLGYDYAPGEPFNGGAPERQPIQ